MQELNIIFSLVTLALITITFSLLIGILIMDTIKRRLKEKSDY